VKDGMFGSVKHAYPVTTQPFGWTVRRHMDDFNWIRSVLAGSFPGVYLPPHPPKRFRTSADAYSKQQYFLERFINCIARNPLLRRSVYLEAFLSENDYKAFGNIKKRSAKEKKVKKIHKFWTLDGNVICDPSFDASEKVAMMEFLNETETVKKKIKRQGDAIIASLKTVSNTILDISKSYAVLEKSQVFIPEVKEI
jgi:hypothetical protein